MLVHQGSDPTPPYQALVIRESAKFSEGFAPIGSKAFSVRSPAPVESQALPLTELIVLPTHPGGPAPAAGYRPEVADRVAGPPGYGLVPRPRAALPRHERRKAIARWPPAG